MRGDIAFEADDFLRDLGTGIRTTAEDIRRAVAYTDQQVTRGIRDGYRAPLDSELPWYKRAWLYSSDSEKVMLVIAGIGLAFVVYDHFGK